MPLTFSIHPNEGLVEQYRELLLNDWDPPALDRALALARQVLHDAGLHVVFRWMDPPSKDRAHPQRSIIPPGASDDVADYISRLNKQKAEAHRKRQAPDRMPDAALRQAEEAAFHLAAPSERSLRPSEVVIEDPTGFYRDVRSIVFRLAVEHLLPTLLGREPGYAYFLAGTLSEFARTEWDDQPQHRDTLLAELFEQLGRKDEARGLRESALHATSPEAHEYLTKAQTLIHTLLDLDEVDAAERELFRVIRATSGEQDEELQGMLRDIHVARGVRLAGPAPTSTR